jgi:hypothetical protein
MIIISNFRACAWALMAIAAASWCISSYASDKDKKSLWFEPFTASISYSDKFPGLRPTDFSIVRRFDLICAQETCYLTVLTIESGSCELDNHKALKADSGIGVQVLELRNDGSGDGRFTFNPKNSIVLEFPDNPPLTGLNDFLVLTYKTRLGLLKEITKFSGIVSGVAPGNSEPQSVKYNYLPHGTNCSIHF